MADYAWHPEHKSGDPNGGSGTRASVGLLPRLQVIATGVPLHIGKESNRLDEEEGGAIVDPDEVTVEYRDPRAEWEMAPPALRRLRDERGWRYLPRRQGCPSEPCGMRRTGGSYRERRRERGSRRC
ncbi:MAG: hypothetical protein EPN50_04435 [Chloroflexota bacterium]|nr:MAG: hypothetical protein EPN50_04435 [Chloroflexota bacterium]